MRRQMVTTMYNNVGYHFNFEFNMSGKEVNVLMLAFS